MGFFDRRRRRATESSDEMIAASGAAGAYGYDPIDRDYGFTSTSSAPRQVPQWTLEKSRASSIASYRGNPMGRAILDTYTSFCVGDSGLSLQCINDEVRQVAEEFWNDPANNMADQDVMLRSHLLNGESVYEMLVGAISAVTQRSPVDPARISGIGLDRGNALWPATVEIRTPGGDPTKLAVIRTDMFSELRTGDAFLWRSFRALETDLRGTPFLMPVLDWLDNYDQVMSNLIDRTAVARYIAMHYKLSGSNGETMDQDAIDAYVKQRGGNHMPRSGSSEFTNDRVEITPLNIQSGAFEDTQTAEAALTSVAAGTGLSKHWIAEPGDVNRATSLSMAEPVRRRVGGVQSLWLGYVTEMVRFAVDKAVESGRLSPLVDVSKPGESSEPAGEANRRVTPKRVPASMAVRVTGPEVAAADSNIVATVLANLSLGLDKLVSGGFLSKKAADMAAAKAWEEFTGVPFTPDLAAPDTPPEKLAQHVDDNAKSVASAPVTLMSASA